MPKCRNLSVGAALPMWSDAIEIQFRKLKLSSYCTVFQAELLAVCKATEEALKRPETSFGIFSDSRSSLQTIASSATLHPLAVQIRENLRECEKHQNEIQLFWIKAHAGLEGNERADVLAREAALKLKTKPHYDKCPISFKHQIRLETLDEWNRRYKSGETAGVTKMFFPDAMQAYHITKKIPIDKHLTQAITGHGGFSAYLYRFKCKDSPSCICDPVKEETVEHILTECPVYGIERFNLEQEIDLSITAEKKTYDYDYYIIQ